MRSGANLLEGKMLKSLDNQINAHPYLSFFLRVCGALFLLPFISVADKFVNGGWFWGLMWWLSLGVSWWGHTLGDPLWIFIPIFILYTFVLIFGLEKLINWWKKKKK